MPSFSYRCPQCCTTSPRVLTHDAALAEQAIHRDQFHGGHRPDGDAVTCYRTERWSEADHLERWITVVLVAVILLVLAYNTL
ncbi:hypothetical protein ACFRQM_09435 [Streptomyces sp. NPDC056831]|uniref:hypothetical protein n=1 Tax=Streptomyces sp. NPDC056831 TaxID=3345954 RepID=UPI003689FFA8